MWPLLLPLALIANAIGSGVQAVGAWKKGEADERYYNDLATATESQVKEVEKTAKLQRGFSAEKEYKDVYKLRSTVRQYTAAQEAAGAASGVGAGSVVSQDIATDTLTKGAMDQALISHNADLERWNIDRERDAEIVNLNNQAKNYRTAGRNAREAGEWNAVSSILGGASSVASTWLLGSQNLTSGVK